MTRVVLFDVDGLLLTPRKEFFSVRYAREHDVDPELIRQFFLGDFKKASFGQADLKELLAPLLPTWNWTGTPDEFLNEWFSAESAREEEAIAYVDRLREKGIRCYITTRQEKYRMQYLLDEVGLRKHFDGYFVTCEIGHDKNTSEFYQHILNTVDVPASEVLFFDDTEANVEAARNLGIEAYFYDGIHVLHEHVDLLLTA